LFGKVNGKKCPAIIYFYTKYKRILILKEYRSAGREEVSVYASQENSQENRKKVCKKVNKKISKESGKEGSKKSS
jgi:hypothetical protein